MDRVLRAARASGSLNLSNKSLTDVPGQVFNLQEGLGADEKWWEVVDLQKLILSHNKLSRIDEALGQLAALTLLDLSHNELPALPDSLSSLQALKSLDISSNHLIHLSPSVGALTSLVRLVLNQNELTTLPSELGSCPGLTELKLANNHLNDIPASLGACKRLTALDFEGNELHSVPTDLFTNLSALTDLNLSKNSLESLPELLSKLSSLVRLDVRQNKLEALPDGIAHCKALAELYLGFNLLSTLPVEIASVQSLGTLDLRNNKLTEFPASACGLRLQLLDLSNNDLSGLPAQLGTMTTLRKLVLDGNPLRTIRSTLVTGPTTNLLKYLRSRIDEPKVDERHEVVRSGNIFGKGVVEQVAAAGRSAASSGTLSLPGRRLSEVPAIAWEGGPLIALDLSRNSITDLPQELSMCTTLEVLNLADNQLCEWPGSTLASLPALQRLLLARNTLNQLPEGAFLATPNLRVLDLSGMAKAISATADFAYMPHLEELRLGLMQLKEVPFQVPQLASLRILDLKQNAITSIPESLATMTKLEELDLSNNDIATLPPRLGLLEPTLRSLKVEGNPLRTIRRPILERGTKALLQYLKDKVPSLT